MSTSVEKIRGHPIVFTNSLGARSVKPACALAHTYVQFSNDRAKPRNVAPPCAGISR
jgi:hypothetical protein